MTFWRMNPGESRYTAAFGRSYTYSQVTMPENNQWPHCLIDIKNRLANLTGIQFNAVLLNYYKGASQSIGMHADDERELGRNPTIASLSIGETRTLRLKRKNSNETSAIPMTNGDLFLFLGSMQEHWLHGVPKSPLQCGNRINLTYRVIKPVPLLQRHSRSFLPLLQRHSRSFLPPAASPPTLPSMDTTPAPVTRPTSTRPSQATTAVNTMASWAATPGTFRGERLVDTATQTAVLPADISDQDTEEISMTGSVGADVADLIDQLDEEDNDQMPVTNLNGIEVIVLSSELESTSYVDVVNTPPQLDDSNATMIDVQEVTLTPDEDEEEGDLDTTTPLMLECHVVLDTNNNVMPDLSIYRSRLSSASSSSSNMSISSTGSDASASTNQYESRRRSTRGSATPPE
jgi:alkylated DNA repair dioxygenase AlkB